MAKIGLLLMMILWDLNFCNAQIRTTTLSQSQILEIQKLPLQETRSILSGLGWKVFKDQKNQLKSYFNYSLGFKTERWQPDLKNQWEGTLYIYYRDNYPNLVIYQTTKTVFNNLKPTYIQTIKDKNVDISIVTKSGLAVEFRNYLLDRTSKKYSILCYDIESIKNLIYTEKQKAEELAKDQKTNPNIQPTKDKQLKADESRSSIYSNNKTLGDEFYRQGQFEKALNLYRLAQKDADQSNEKELADLDEKIQNCLKNRKVENIPSLKNKADDLFTQEKYRESLQAYEAISKLDTGNQSIKDRIRCIKKIIEISKLENTNQIYRKINPEGYANFNDINIRALDFMMRKSGDHGNINYTFNIKFDNKGNNLSNFKVNSISDEKLMFNMSDITVNAIPASELFIPCINQIKQIASTDILNYSLKWESTKFRAFVKNNILYSDSIHDKAHDTINAFINQLSSKNGIYTFKIKDKILNDRLYQDVWLTSYKDNALKATSFIPGFATYNSSGGKRGKGTMVAFLLSAAFAAGSKIYSDHQFDRYKNASNNNERDHYYNRANFANKCFMISGGFAVGIYLYDLSSFIIRTTGIKNNKNNRLKAELKNGPVSIMENSFNP